MGLSVTSDVCIWSLGAQTIRSTKANLRLGCRPVKQLGRGKKTMSYIWSSLAAAPEQDFDTSVLWEVLLFTLVQS